jgi:hypothetical protein
MPVLRIPVVRIRQAEELVREVLGDVVLEAPVGSADPGAGADRADKADRWADREAFSDRLRSSGLA